MFIAWMERFREVPFYRLDVGRLDRSVELLEGIVR